MQKHRKMYEEDLVKDVMISTALCVQEFMRHDSWTKQDDVLGFVDANFRQIIFETLRAQRTREI